MEDGIPAEGLEWELGQDGIVCLAEGPVGDEKADQCEDLWKMAGKARKTSSETNARWRL